MKKLFILTFSITALILCGCFDTIQEVSLNDDGTGILKNTNDMSALLGMAKQIGGKEATEKLGDKQIDSTYSLDKMLDSSATLSVEEKAMARGGHLHINLDAKADKFIHTMILPFKSPADIDKLNKISEKLMQEAMEKQLGKMPEMGMEDIPDQTHIDDYFTITYSKGHISKELHAEKYKNAEKDEYLKGMKEAAAMGIPMTATYVFHLPSPAKKVEGKNVKISQDGKQVTLKASIEDFFDDPAKFTFRIEY